MIKKKVSNCSLSLADALHEFQIHVSVRILTMKISQWARVKFSSYVKIPFSFLESLFSHQSVGLMRDWKIEHLPNDIRKFPSFCYVPNRKRGLPLGVVYECFLLCQRFRKFRSEVEWKGTFWFLLTGIFGITSGCSPLISVGILRPKLLTNRVFTLAREKGGIKKLPEPFLLVGPV